MWTAIGLAVGLFGLLLALGWHDSAVTITAAALLLACVAVCIWAGVQGHTAEREVDRAIARLAATRSTELPWQLPEDHRRRALLGNAIPTWAWIVVGVMVVSMLLMAVRAA